jgi:CRISPR/Cas system endoribonuclease Cas6 (RAMP superfamily)
MGLKNTVQYNYNKFVSFRPICKRHIYVKMIKICPLQVSLNKKMSFWMMSYVCVYINRERERVVVKEDYHHDMESAFIDDI